MSNERLLILKTIFSCWEASGNLRDGSRAYVKTFNSNAMLSEYMGKLFDNKIINDIRTEEEVVDGKFIALRIDGKELDNMFRDELIIHAL